MAGLNCQDFQQLVSMGPTLIPRGTTGRAPFTPSLMSATFSNHTDYAREFTPLIELRLEGRYQITRSISFHAGWTGWWMDGIARANSVVDYTVPRWESTRPTTAKASLSMV